MNISQQCAFVAKKTSGILACIASMSGEVILIVGAVSGILCLVVARQLKEVILLLHVVFMQPHCECCMQSWAS